MIFMPPERARDARKKLNLDQATLAKALGVSLRTVSHWEAHGVKPGPAVLVLLGVLWDDALPRWMPTEDVHGRAIHQVASGDTQTA